MPRFSNIWAISYSRKLVQLLFWLLAAGE